MGKTGIIIIIGCVFIMCSIICAFMIFPNMDWGFVYTPNISMRLPVNDNDLRYSNSLFKGFCNNQYHGIDIEVADGSAILSASDGTVVSTDNGIVIQSGKGYVVYSNVGEVSVIPDEFVTSGDIIGYVSSNVLSFRVQRYVNGGTYVCPYDLFDDDGKNSLNNIIRISEYGTDICECEVIEEGE